MDQRIPQMTLGEKVSLLSGADHWHTKEIERLGIGQIMMSDGPHGLRAQFGDTDHLGMNESEKSTCFPTASATACSFDPELLERVGAAIAREAKSLGISMVLGPGTNIKRHPFCGRNFEYFSEDPYLSGQMAAAFIQGVQKEGVGACLKHFAANNQEKARLINDSVVDERALRELYLPAFEYAVKTGNPRAVMCSYNQLNGTFASENPWLLEQVLRREWGYEGAVISDWGAVSDRAKGVAAGLDLEMPYVGPEHDEDILRAVREGRLSEEAVDRCVARVLKLQDSAAEKQPCDLAEHHALAREAAERSAVLLKNEGNLLPLDQRKSYAVLGGFAKSPRYQGAGSSHIAPMQVDLPYEELKNSGLNVAYSEGYSSEELEPDAEKIRAAVALAKEKDCALIFAGLPERMESEGFDRETLQLPPSHLRLIEEVSKVNENTVLILSCGAPVALPKLDRVKAVLLMYLGGEAMGSACTSLLTGAANPGGKLAETWPKSVEDVASHPNFAVDSFRTEYRESLMVGYRWFDTAGIDPAYPFGYGLSYTEFRLDGAELRSREDGYAVRVKLENVGERAGDQVIQVYVRKKNSRLLRPDRELKAFRRVHLLPGDKETVELLLPETAFRYYDVQNKTWQTEAGDYEILVGTSSRDIEYILPLTIKGETPTGILPESYGDLNLKKKLSVSDADFAALFPDGVPETKHIPRPYHENSTISDLKHSFLGRIILKVMLKVALKQYASDEAMLLIMKNSLYDYPLRAISMSKVLTVTQTRGLIDILNRHPIKGLRKMLKKQRTD